MQHLAPIMKRFPHKIAMILPVLAVAVGCVDASDDTSYSGGNPKPSVIEFTKEGGKITYNIDTEDEWVIFGTTEWVNIYPVSGSGKATVTFTAPEYDNYWEVRSFEFVLSEGAGEYTYLTVTQRGNSTATLEVAEGAEITVGHDGMEKTITIESNTEWEITGMNQWVQVYPRSGKGNTKVAVTTYDNPADANYLTTLKVNGKGVSSPLSVRVLAAAASN